MVLKVITFLFCLFFINNSVNAAAASGDSVVNVGEIRAYLGLDKLRGLHGEGTSCFFIESQSDKEGKPSNHRIIIEHLIRAVAPALTAHHLEKNEPEDSILKRFFSIEAGMRIPIVNFSGDFVRNLHYLGSTFVPYRAEFAASYRDFLSQDSFWYKIEGKNKDYITSRLESIAEASIVDHTWSTKETSTDISRRHEIATSALVEAEALKAFAPDEEYHDLFAKGLAIVEYKLNCAHSERIRALFYTPLLKGKGNTILVAAMGNDRRLHPIVEVFGPQRALFSDPDSLKHMINVVNLGEGGAIDPSSDRPDNHGRGNGIIEDFFPGLPIPPNPLQELSEPQLAALQDSTIAARGEWGGEIGGTSAAAPLVTGALLLVQQTFPELTWEQLREAVLYSAERTFRATKTDAGDDEDSSAATIQYVDNEKPELLVMPSPRGVPVKSFPPEVYGQGILSIERALKYAEFIREIYHRKNVVEIGWPKDYIVADAVLRRQAFNRFVHKG
ncbi:MAG: S8 family serine peptidase [Alphaproteobacteria bacterium]|nr:S8 family serine peptidase [Alphaproteobacteria bacterium]